MSPASSLVDMPDEILLQVMSYLTTSDLLLLARTCRRLCRLLSDRSLWRHVDLRQSRLRARQLARLLRHLHADTRRVCLTGHVSRARPLSQRQPLLTARCLTDIKTRCESLVELRLERCVMNAKELPLDLLPESLLCLSLRGSEVTHRPAGRSYFYRLWELTPRLVELDLSGSGWLDSHALLPLSKLAQLRRLSLRGCPRLGGVVAYSSIACMLGFRALEALDVRGTQVSDSDVSGFCQLPQLSELLLEPGRRRLIDGDATLRQLGQHRGRQMRRLALRRCPISERAVEQLPQLLPELRQLDLTRAAVPAKRRRWLAEQLPDCVVSCHESKLELGPEVEPEPGPGPGVEPEPEPGPGPGPRRRRRRSPSPQDVADGAPPGKRRRLSPCQCVGCAAGSDAEKDMDVPQEEEEEEEQEQEPGDLENRPGVIVVNLFDRGAPGAPQPGDPGLRFVRRGQMILVGNGAGFDRDWARGDGEAGAGDNAAPPGEGQAGDEDAPAEEAGEAEAAEARGADDDGVAAEARVVDDDGVAAEARVVGDDGVADAAVEQADEEAAGDPIAASEAPEVIPEPCGAQQRPAAGRSDNGGVSPGNGFSRPDCGSDAGFSGTSKLRRRSGRCGGSGSGGGSAGEASSGPDLALSPSEENQSQTDDAANQ